MKFLPKTVDSQFLVRIIRNEAGPEEREYFQKWLEESEEHKEEYGNLLLLWDKFQYSHLPVLPQQEEQWEKIEKAIKESQRPCPDSAFPSFPQIYTSEPEKKNPAKKEFFVWLYRIAAVIIISLTIYFAENSRKEIKISEPVSSVQNPSPEIKYYTLTTKKGEKANLSLSDGSVIFLNSDSKLKYPNYFGTSSREVELEGEGYFKISSDKKRPFRVNCNNTVTEVTGTEFNIKSRADNLSIIVVEGSVKTFSSRKHESIAVKRGEMITKQGSGKFSGPVKVNLRHSIVWRENKISFSRTPLASAAEELERCYSNIDIIVVSDSLKQKTITGIFDTNSLNDILSVFSLTMDIKVSRNGNKIYFE